MTFLKEEVKKFLGFFFFLLFFILIAVNWGTVKGIFDYKAIYKDIFDSFKKKEVITVPRIALEAPKKEFPYTEKADSIEIPKIAIAAPLIFVESESEEDYKAPLLKGVVHYYQSSLPGEPGQTIILGHSAPSGWPHINYDWVFSSLNDLNTGDEVFVNYKNHQYHYVVSGKLFLDKGEEIPSADLTNFKNVLILISCWPPGVNKRRIAIEAELINP
jgi:LPXTG-site transpeptidase (sortase) family protein